MQTAFGPGVAWGERLDVVGSGIGPVPFAVPQDVTIDVDFTYKPLWGQNQFALISARGQGKITGKIKKAQIFMETYSDLVFGLTSTTGQFAPAQNEAQTVPASTPFTVSVANAANFVNDGSAGGGDLGVLYANGSGRFTRVATPAAAGQYSVNPATGVYTFSSADANAAVMISYVYNNTVSGNKLAIVSQPTGTTPIFRFTYYQKVSPQPPLSGFAGGLASKLLSFRLNACSATKWSVPSKLDDWTIDEIDFDVFADSAGNIGSLSTSE